MQQLPNPTRTTRHLSRRSEKYDLDLAFVESLSDGVGTEDCSEDFVARFWDVEECAFLDVAMTYVEHDVCEGGRW